jgi:hypothetical protein
MKTSRDFTTWLTLLSLCVAAPATAGQAMSTVNIATSAAGQSGYIAALI